MLLNLKLSSSSSSSASCHRPHFGRSDSFTLPSHSPTLRSPLLPHPDRSLKLLCSPVRATHSPLPSTPIREDFASPNCSTSRDAATAATSLQTTGAAPHGIRIGGGGGGARMKKLTATVTIRPKRPSVDFLTFLQKGTDALADTAIFQQLDATLDSARVTNVVLQLISTTIDPKTKKGKLSQETTLKDWEKKSKYVADKVEYTAEFLVEDDFGVPGAIIIVNEHSREFYLETISLESGNGQKVYFSCNSWDHSKLDSSEKRIFFSNQVYLPEETPESLKKWREHELHSIRGDGRGQRRKHERIYDYAAYNDLGNPDSDKSLARPTVGGSKELPYPRRLRTGRPSTKTDLSSESVLGKGSYYYVPRDEAFEELKQESYVAGFLKLLIHELLPLMQKALTKQTEFQCFSDIDRMYKESITIHEQQPDIFSKMMGLLPNFSQPKLVVPRFLEELEESLSLQFSAPQSYSKDRFSWMRDDEFGRQALAGINPMQIELMKSFPPVSNLDPEIYGPKESAIKEEHIQRQLDGLSVEEALLQKRLFIIDYHDAYMPFVNKINAMKDRKLYASRTVFFMSEAGTMLPVAIELSLPPQSPGEAGSKRVFTPGQDASSHWLWQLAKAHAASNDTGFHQLVNHWLRSHAVVEPYVIATHRQLSTMHPISKLLLPHLRYTLEINALARQLLINADGVIENCFTPGHYSMEISSAAYDSMWRFDMENLPADLLRRGMAVEDPEKPGELKLVVEDYPYAADGLLIWKAIKEWVKEYVDIYYSDPEVLEKDKEIHEWWGEIRSGGHADKAHESWWPELRTKEDLVSILSSIIWVTSAHHAAVNFGQYAYGGYVPNRPPMTRRLIPEQDIHDKEYQELVKNPQKFFLSMISNKFEATVVMSVLDSLSTHAADEEYLGQRAQANWTADARAKAAAEAFARNVKEIEETIDRRNTDSRLKNRNGVGVLPYEYLRPTSAPGVTGRGIPNSVSI